MRGSSVRLIGAFFFLFFLALRNSWEKAYDLLDNLDALLPC